MFTSDVHSKSGKILLTKTAIVKKWTIGAQWSRALHHSASCATRDSGFAPRLSRSLPRPGGPSGDAQLAEHRPGYGGFVAGRDILVSSRTRDYCGGPGAVHADRVARCAVFPPTHWCGWLPGWMRTVLRSSAAWLGCVSEDAWLSTFVSPEPVREL